jgi:hypothetical protein
MPIRIGDLKKQWLTAVDAARTLIEELPTGEVGCLYLDSTGTPVTPVPSSDSFATLARHWGSVHGAWPTISP